VSDDNVRAGWQLVLEYSILLWITLSTARRVYRDRLTARNVGKKTLDLPWLPLRSLQREDIAVLTVPTRYSESVDLRMGYGRRVSECRGWQRFLVFICGKSQQAVSCAQVQQDDGSRSPVSYVSIIMRMCMQLSEDGCCSGLGLVISVLLLLSPSSAVDSRGLSPCTASHHFSASSDCIR
jgi:hypothetical protein